MRSPLSHTPTSSPDIARLWAAQRLITLEQRIYLPPPSSPTSPLSGVQLQLDRYGSPSSERPSPVSLPSRAKRFIRGPARSAPPNTPVSGTWDESDKGEDETGSGGYEVLPKAEHLPMEGHEIFMSERGWEAASPVMNGPASTPSSANSTPCPTPRTANNISRSNSEVRKGQVESRHNEEAEASTLVMDGDEAINPGGQSTSPTPFRISHHVLHRNHPKDEKLQDGKMRYDWSTLEGIAAELSGEITLGYEIRHFAWKK